MEHSSMRNQPPVELVRSGIQMEHSCPLPVTDSVCSGERITSHILLLPEGVKNSSTRHSDSQREQNSVS